MPKTEPVQIYGVRGRKEYGLCVLCGNRVYNHHDFITSEEGYCHKSCLPEA